MSTKAAEYFDQYWKHASVLRNWFVAYGVGSLAVIITHKEIFNKNNNLKIFIFLICVGVLSQIILTLINKIIHWCIYLGEEDPGVKDRFWYKASARISSCFWIDVIVDFLTTILYVSAFYQLVINF